MVIEGYYDFQLGLLNLQEAHQVSGVFAGRDVIFVCLSCTNFPHICGSLVFDTPSSLLINIIRAATCLHVDPTPAGHWQEACVIFLEPSNCKNIINHTFTHSY